jgi:hypothetical protein
MTDIRRDLMEAGANHYETFIRRHYHLIVDIETDTLYQMWEKFAEKAKFTTWNEQSYHLHIKQYTGGAKQKRIGKARPYVHNMLPDKLKDLQERDKRDKEKVSNEGCEPEKMSEKEIDENVDIAIGRNKTIMPNIDPNEEDKYL